MSAARRPRGLRAALLALALGCAACGPARPSMPWVAGDSLFVRGRYAAAAAAYERELARRPDAPGRAEAQLRLALSYLAQEETRDQARAVLETLARRPARRLIGRQAALLLAQMRQLDRAHARAQRARDELAAAQMALRSLARKRLQLAAELHVTEAERTAEREELQRELEQRDALMRNQKAEIERLAGEAQRLQQQLDALKDIDLERRN